MHPSNPREQFAHSILSAPQPDSFSRTRRALELVASERIRQDLLVATGKLPFNCASDFIANARKLPVLVEETGEVAKALYELDNVGSHLDSEAQRAHLRTELVQLAAVCVAWVEALSEEPQRGSVISAHTLGNGPQVCANPERVVS